MLVPFRFASVKVELAGHHDSPALFKRDDRQSTRDGFSFRIRFFLGKFRRNLYRFSWWFGK